MTVTLTQDNVLGRIRVDATALGTQADYATIERSIDQITWTMCRGASAWPVTSGAFSNPYDDYEFTDGVANYYRVRSHESDAISLIGSGASATGNNASVVPPLPGSLTDRDAMYLYASIRNSGAGTVNTPAGWTLIRASGNAALFGRYFVTGDGNPTVSFAGGVANADTTARITAFRRSSIVPTTGTDQLNGSAQNIAAPALAVPEDDMLLLDVLWKQDDISGSTPRAGFLFGASSTSTAGDDAFMGLWYQIQTDAADVTAASYTITGGAAAISRAMTLAFEHIDYLTTQTDSITPALTGVWIKSLRRPFLNRIVNVEDYSDPTRASRSGAFDIIGRTLPLGVADVMSGRRWTLTVYTTNLSDADDLDTVLAAGDIWFVHVPVDCTVPGGYVIVDGDVVRRRTKPPAAKRSTPYRYFDVPLLEVATPDDDVAGSTSTWATVIAGYATWSDLIADKATWADVLELIGSAGEVIVP